MNPIVSVIVPFYGNSYSRRLELVTESVLFQKNVNVDFIIAGLDKATGISCLPDLQNHPRGNVPDIVRTGAAINNGFRLAKGNFAYVSDADILLQNQNYLERLVQEHLALGASLKRPPMRRLLLEDFEWFYSQVSSTGLENATTLLDKSHEYIVKPKGSERPMRIFPKFENGKQKKFIASETDFREYISSEDSRGSEPYYFNQDRHCGAVFTRTEHLLKAGGYHEGFISWGVWDADIQWKLENLTGMRLIPYNEDFSVIHLDHRKSHFSKSKWEHDRKLQEIRRSIGPKECIRKDKEDYMRRRNGR